MRLLLASYYYPPSVGGLQRQSHLLARGLTARGHRVHVISARLPGLQSREWLDGVNVERVSAGSGRRGKKMATYIVGMLWAAFRTRAQTDVVQVQQALYPAAAMALLARAAGRPLVVRNAGSGYFGAVREMQRLPAGATCLRLIGGLATTVALNSEMATEMRSARFRQVVRIPNGVAIPAPTTDKARWAARAALGIDGHLVLYCGRLAVEKGVDTLIAAWQALGKRQVGTLAIVGEGPALQRLRQQAETMAATAGSVQFRGTVDDVQPYLRAADVFVLPSRSEGVSNALLEAMAAGLPVIATDVGGNREVLGGADVGLVVPHEDPAALADAIGDLIDRPQRAAYLGASAREHVARYYSIDRMVTAYENLYAGLMGH